MFETVRVFEAAGKVETKVIDHGTEQEHCSGQEPHHITPIVMSEKVDENAPCINAFHLEQSLKIPLRPSHGRDEYQNRQGDG